jgi:hypothetical protein
MSIIALKWAYTQKVGNPIAKNILAFLASHNFAGDQSVFKVRTIMAATEYEESSVRRGLKFLAEMNLIKKQIRYGERGQQLSNEYTLNIPTEYKDDFYSSYGVASVDNSMGGVSVRQGGGVSQTAPPLSTGHPLNNNKYNNNINTKSFCDKDEQKKHKAGDKREDWKEANQKKHSWAEKAKEPPRADVTRQSTSYDPSQHTDTPRFDPNAPGYQAFLDANPAVRRAHERRKKNAAKANELSTGTPVQPEVPTRSVSNEQSASIDVDRSESDSPPVRGANRLMETCGVHSYLEKAGMAGTH